MSKEKFKFSSECEKSRKVVDCWSLSLFSRLSNLKFKCAGQSIVRFGRYIYAVFPIHTHTLPSRSAALLRLPFSPSSHSILGRYIHIHRADTHACARDRFIIFANESALARALSPRGRRAISSSRFCFPPDKRDCKKGAR